MPIKAALRERSVAFHLAKSRGSFWRSMACRIVAGRIIDAPFALGSSSRGVESMLYYIW